MRALHVFAGAGGSVQACRKLGIESVGCVELDRYCCAVLKQHGEEVLAQDITTFHADGLVGQVDIVIGGSPCQDVSTAGRRQGFRGTKSILWRDQVRVAQECRAPLIWWENVRGALSSNGGRDFGTVLSDLDDAGYDAKWITNLAADVGAPHKRERLWLLAWRRVGDSISIVRQWRADEQRRREEARTAARRSGAPLGISSSVGCVRDRPSREQELEPQDVLATATGRSIHGISSSGSTCCADQHAGGLGGGVPEVAGVAHSTCRGCAQQRGGWSAESSDAASECPGGRQAEPCMGRAVDGMDSRVDCPADRGLWPAPQGQPQYPWEEPRVIAGAKDGRTHRLKALGNGWVPQQAVAAWWELTDGFDP